MEWSLICSITPMVCHRIVVWTPCVYNRRRGRSWYERCTDAEVVVKTQLGSQRSTRLIWWIPWVTMIAAWSQSCVMGGGLSLISSGLDNNLLIIVTPARRSCGGVPRWTEVHWGVYICSALQVRWSAYQVRWMLNWLYAFVQADVHLSARAIIQMRKKCAGSMLICICEVHWSVLGVLSLACLKCNGVLCSALGVRSLAYLECIAVCWECVL